MVQEGRPGADDAQHGALGDRAEPLHQLSGISRLSGRLDLLSLLSYAPFVDVYIISSINRLLADAGDMFTQLANFN